MKLELLSRSEISNAERYFVRPIAYAKILVSYNYNQLSIIDYNFNKIKAFDFKKNELVTDDYFSDDRIHFLWNSEERYLYYLNFEEGNKPIKSRIPKNILLGGFYVWNNNKFIMAGIERGKVDSLLFFRYDIKLNVLDEISSVNALKKYPYFQEVFKCNARNYLLYYNIKKEILVYRELRDDDDDEIVLESSLCKKNIKINHVDKEVHRADYLDGFLVLVHKEYVVFYYAGVEFFSINMDKKDWAFYLGYLFKHGDDFYCLVTQLDTYQPKRNIIEIYKIEK